MHIYFNEIIGALCNAFMQFFVGVKKTCCRWCCEWKILPGPEETVMAFFEMLSYELKKGQNWAPLNKTFIFYLKGGGQGDRDAHTRV